MDVENVSELIDYVYTDEDFNLKPSMQEYQKLKRIMKVMVRFYQKGTDSKKGQLELATDERAKLVIDKKMIEEQMAAIDQFPPFHPKRQEYEGQLERELEALIEQDKVYQEQEKNFAKLLEWSKGVVRAVEWLELRLEQYCNSLFEDLNLEQNPISLTVDEYKFYSKCLDEITFNLQESQDFFNASVDGRLKMFHQLEKCMIEAQLEVIRKYPEDNLRRKHVETELLKDLEYVSDNMKENPVVLKHREKMRLMHVDFFKLLKWQREMMLRLPFDAPNIFCGGDLEALKLELNAKEKEGPQEEPQYANGQGQTDGLHVKYREFTASQQSEAANGDGTCPVNNSVNGAASVNEAMNGLNLNECPVMHKKSADKPEGFIHKVYDESVKI